MGRKHDTVLVLNFSHHTHAAIRWLKKHTRKFNNKQAENIATSMVCKQRSIALNSGMRLNFQLFELLQSLNFRSITICPQTFICPCHRQLLFLCSHSTLMPFKSYHKPAYESRKGEECWFCNKSTIDQLSMLLLSTKEKQRMLWSAYHKSSIKFSRPSRSIFDTPKRAHKGGKKHGLTTNIKSRKHEKY